MYERVDKTQQSSMTTYTGKSVISLQNIRFWLHELTGKVFEPNESGNRHQRMMVQMQERNLILFLTKHEKHGIQKLSDLAYVVQPHSTSHLNFQ